MTGEDATTDGARTGGARDGASSRGTDGSGPDGSGPDKSGAGDDRGSDDRASSDRASSDRAHSGANIDGARIRAAVSELIEAIGENPTRPGLVDTPSRVADAYAEFFAGVGDDPLRHLADTETLADAGQQPGELIMMRGIDFRSMCEHHLLPFLGIAHIAYLPRDRVIGLGKLPRVVETLAARPQLQERLTEQIADAIEQGLDAIGVLVVLEASHGCVTARDIRQRNSTTVTLAARGTLAEPAERAEAMALIGKA